MSRPRRFDQDTAAGGENRLRRKVLLHDGGIVLGPSKRLVRSVHDGTQRVGCARRSTVPSFSEPSFMAWLLKPRQAARRRRGVLTLEWILLVTVIVIGIIGGLGVVRNATVGELRDLAEAITHLNVKTTAETTAEGMGS
jgi:hypothetical protein